MKVPQRLRLDAVFISAVLFTIAFVSLLPPCLRAAWTSEVSSFQQAGASCLANILAGLLVTWLGLGRRFRWSWFVLFIIVWVGEFPILVLPFFQHTLGISIAEGISRALREPGSPRSWAEGVLIFALMVVALLLPIKSLFVPATTRGLSESERS